jgi:hypothetical protein
MTNPEIARTVSQPAHDRLPPAQGLHQARDQLRGELANVDLGESVIADGGRAVDRLGVDRRSNRRTADASAVDSRHRGCMPADACCEPAPFAHRDSREEPTQMSSHRALAERFAQT